MKKIHWLALGALTVISLIGEFWFAGHGDHAEHWWTGIPGFFIFYGFIGCMVIIFFSKALGKLFLQKREEYYDER